jgi:uroporphyrinogen decarboxylase
MDINEVKKKYGDKLAILGNIDVDKLTRGSKEEVIVEVKKRIKEIGQGGGYCIGSSNSIPEWMNYDNYVTMIQSALKFGNYPIAID